MSRGLFSYQKARKLNCQNMSVNTRPRRYFHPYTFYPISFTQKEVATPLC